MLSHAPAATALKVAEAIRSSPENPPKMTPIKLLLAVEFPFIEYFHIKVRSRLLRGLCEKLCFPADALLRGTNGTTLSTQVTAALIVSQMLWFAGPPLATAPACIAAGGQGHDEEDEWDLTAMDAAVSAHVRRKSLAATEDVASASVLASATIVSDWIEKPRAAGVTNTEYDQPKAGVKRPASTGSHNMHKKRATALE